MELGLVGLGKMGMNMTVCLCVVWGRVPSGAPTQSVVDSLRHQFGGHAVQKEGSR